MYTLSPRLKTIAGLVPKGDRVADIGTDHGYLPVFLIKNNIASYVFACDINEKPLLSARRNIEAAEVSQIELHLCDGLAGLREDEIDTVIIAGMGGEVIAGILSRSDWIKNSHYRLLLQPMTSAEELRKFLCSEGFRIKTETAIEDAGKIYTVISAQFDGKKRQYPDAYMFIGELSNTRDADIKYIKKQLKRIEKCADDLVSVPAKQDEYLYYKRVADDISAFLGGK